MISPILGVRYQRFRPRFAGIAALSASAFALVVGCGGSNAAPDQHKPARNETFEGDQAFGKGAFEEALAFWERTMEFCRASHDIPCEIDAQVRLAAAHEALGEFGEAINLLNEAAGLASAANDRERMVLANSNLGEAYSFTHRSDLAESSLATALDIAQEDNDLKAAGFIYNSLGNLFVAQGKLNDATDAYRQSVSFSRMAHNQLLVAKALGNSAAAAAPTEAPDDVTRLNDSAVQEALKVQDSHEKAVVLMTCAQTYQQLMRRQPTPPDAIVAGALNAYNAALQTAQTIGDKRAASYALGGLGGTLEQVSRYAEALDATRQAAFLAQETQTREAIYRWEWQAGRLLKAQGQTAEAIAAYRRAIRSLQAIRNDLALTYANRPGAASFREQVGPVYYELADLLLSQADTLADPMRVQQNLLAARDVVEQLKTAELEDYFQDECVNLVRTTRVENVSADAAVLYVIPLSDRTEVLVGFSTGLMRFKAPVGSQQLEAEARQFRKNLETRTTYEYLEQARKLYDWLIRPIKEEFDRRHIQTLVFVPDGALRTVPFAALQDGEQFLIEKFSVAVTPGLTLTAPHPSRRMDRLVLLAGLSQAVQGFSPLDYVPTELGNLRGLYRGEELFNKSFLNASLEKDLGQSQYSVVHIASHGQFGHDVGKTFVLTYDGKLTLDGLEHLIRPSQFRKQPVELLTLSACQTAEGDDRAALGLAGVAVKAGARSALATLWFINDQASTYLISEFYSRWTGKETVSKARALQLAQQRMLADRRYRHPCYWAPYLLIGNWL